jgi:exo-1,4-beta-D-glucosaminidase
MKKSRCFLLAVVCIAASVCLARTPGEPESGSKLLLKDGWRIQPSTQVHEKGDVVSTTQFKPRGWYPASVPSTVLAALVQDEVYPDPYFGMNLRSISGTNYPIGDNFSRLHMPPDSPFRSSWWYRREFKIPADYTGRTIWLHFDGINFRANVWLNGRQIATSEKMAGAWRLFEFNITDAAIPGQVNSLAVEVFPPQPDDLAITFVDWNPLPPDKDMGIWREVYLTASGPVALRFPQVITRLDLPSLDKAHLSVTAELKNSTQQPVRGTLKGQIENLQFSQPVELPADESKVVTFSPDKFSQLNLSNPRIWWPTQLGPQNLYHLNIQVECDGKVSDQQAIQFGIREVTSELDAQNHRVFKINGKNILIRGAGWSFDMLLRTSPERQEAELKYVKDMNLNTVRLEGKLEDEHFLNLCDEYGILVLAGWCCCDHWERWQNWKDEDYMIAAESLKDQIRRLRSHASLFDWLNGSDSPPPPKVEEMYIKILKEYNWPNPYQSSATARPTSLTGKSGVKMTGPYEYVAPSYWLLDKTRGGAHGFNTETGPGPAVPPIESLRRMLPADHLWPMNSYWDFHAGGGAFRNLKVFTEALNARYGTATSAEDYAEKAQVMAYEGHRAMFEAYGRNKYTATGVIQWMLNNAWPSMIWHLYDYYLRPGGSYFGAKKGCEPLHIQYSYDDQSIAVVNSFYQPFENLKATAKVYNLDMTEKFSRDATLDVPPDSVNRVLVIPELQGLTTSYFLRLTLQDSAGGLISSNFYWLSTKQDVLDWDRSTWYHTPTKSFSDLTGLKSLPLVDLKAASSSEVRGTEGITRVTVENPTPNLAFFVHLKVRKARAPEEEEGVQGEEEVLPVLWQDNYFPLMPGEKQEITATYRAKDLGKAAPVVEVDGWNVLRKTL